MLNDSRAGQNPPRVVVPLEEEEEDINIKDSINITDNWNIMQSVNIRDKENSTKDLNIKGNVNVK